MMISQFDYGATNTAPDTKGLGDECPFSENRQLVFIAEILGYPPED